MFDFGGFGWNDLGGFECLISVSCLGFFDTDGLDEEGV